MDTTLHTTLYAAPRGTSAAAYEELKSLILFAQLPIGIRLREERLAERLGCSRTPVREALLRLDAERLLERHPQGGYCVAIPRVTAMRELYEIRRALELFALRRGCESELRHERELLECLADEWLSLDAGAIEPNGEFVLADEAFHASLAEAAGNLRLAQELQRVNERIRPIRSRDFVCAERIAVTIEQHLAITEALLAGDAQEAASLLDSHILESQREVEGRVAAALERLLDYGEEPSEW
jgi:DNA-binding GntR family transcriptional regulator